MTHEPKMVREEDHPLVKAVVSLSCNKEWAAAKNEWVYKSTWFATRREDMERCACGHYPIKEIITVANKVNGNEAVIGNCCIQRFNFIGFDSKVFEGLSKQRINESIILLAHKDRIISDWEIGFMLDVYRKKRMSPRQYEYYANISKKILEQYIK